MSDDTGRLLLHPTGGRPIRLGILAFWTAMGLVESSKAYVSFQLRETPRSWGDVLIGNMPWWYVWALLTPLIFALAARFPLDRSGWRTSVALHFLAAIVVSIMHLASTGWLFYLTNTRGSIIASFGQQIRLFADNYLAVNVLTYFAVVGGFHAIDFYRRLREREVSSAQLEARIHEARLAALRMELNPHFLFNALNSVASLVRRREHDAAVGALAGLGDLLRMTLDRQAVQEAPLADELTIMRKYLDIERLRFHDRLTVCERIDPSTLDELVPTLILQTLVENAIRHGIARSPGPGRITVCADRQGTELRLLVRNTGGGFDGAWTSRKATRADGGVGLANTRARLAHLHPGKSALETRDAPGPEGGAEVELRVPCRTKHSANSR